MLDDIQQKALLDCIEHWKRLHSYVLEKNPEKVLEENWGNQSCACCDHYFDVIGVDYCFDCPIRLYSGSPKCRNTPWGKADEYLGFVTDEDKTIDEEAWNNCDDAVQAEVDYLIDIYDIGTSKTLDPNGASKLVHPNDE